MITRFKKLGCLLLIIGGLLWLAEANDIFGGESDFPSKPIELVCAWGAGGASYIGGRIVAETFSKFIGTPVIIIHKTAGGGSAAGTYTAKSKPDGYTLLLSNTAVNGIFLSTRDVDYKNSSFEPLVLYATQPMVLAVKSDAPWKTLKELVADAKKSPGKLKYCTAGLGSSSHFGVELFKIAAGGVKMDAIPFKSGSEMSAAVLGGHGHMGLFYLTDLKGVLEAGMARPLAVASEKRLENFPNIPTFSEEGYEVQWFAWYGISAPAGLPKKVSDKLKDALYKTLRQPDVNDMLAKAGFTPTFKESPEFANFINEFEKKCVRIAKEANIRLD